MNKTIIHVTYSTAVQFTENKVLVRMYLEIPYAETINPKLRKVKDSLFSLSATLLQETITNVFILRFFGLGTLTPICFYLVLH